MFSFTGSSCPSFFPFVLNNPEAVLVLCSVMLVRDVAKYYEQRNGVPGIPAWVVPRLTLDLDDEC